MALSEGRDRLRKGDQGAGAGFLLLSLFGFALWLGLLGYCGYQTYLAIPGGK